MKNNRVNSSSYCETIMINIKVGKTLANLFLKRGEISNIKDKKS